MSHRPSSLLLLLAGLARPGLDTLVGDTAYVTPEWLAATGNPDAALANADQAFLLATGYPPVGGAVAETPAELGRAIADVGLPALLKPRFGAGGSGVHHLARTLSGCAASGE